MVIGQVILVTWSGHLTHNGHFIWLTWSGHLIDDMVKSYGSHSHLAHMVRSSIWLTWSGHTSYSHRQFILLTWSGHMAHMVRSSYSLGTAYIER